MSSDANSEIVSLRRQLFFQLVALVVMAGAVTVYLYRQASMEGKQLTQATRVVAAYKQDEPKIITLLNQLVDYGHHHPDFNSAVLKKYGIGQGTSPAPAAPAK